MKLGYQYIIFILLFRFDRAFCQRFVCQVNLFLESFFLTLQSVDTISVKQKNQLTRKLSRRTTKQ